MAADGERKKAARLERRPEALTYAIDDLLLAVRDGVVSSVPGFGRTVTPGYTMSTAPEVLRRSRGDEVMSTR